MKTKFFGKIDGPTLEDGICSIKHNREIIELYRDLHVVAEVISGLRWVGHALRREENSITKKSLRTIQMGKDHRISHNWVGEPCDWVLRLFRQDLKRLGRNEEEGLWTGPVNPELIAVRSFSSEFRSCQPTSSQIIKYLLTKI